jgi:hypothetical protein
MHEARADTWPCPYGSVRKARVGEGERAGVMNHALPQIRALVPG